MQRWIDDLRVAEAPTLKHVVCAIDPPIVYAHDEVCAILVAGIGDDGHAYVLRDASIKHQEPKNCSYT